MVITFVLSGWKVARGYYQRGKLDTQIDRLLKTLEIDLFALVSHPHRTLARCRLAFAKHHAHIQPFQAGDSQRIAEYLRSHAMQLSLQQAAQQGNLGVDVLNLQRDLIALVDECSLAEAAAETRFRGSEQKLEAIAGRVESASARLATAEGQLADWQTEGARRLGGLETLIAESSSRFESSLSALNHRSGLQRIWLCVLGGLTLAEVALNFIHFH